MPIIKTEEYRSNKKLFYLRNKQKNNSWVRKTEAPVGLIVYLPILASAVSGCVSVSVFPYLVDIPVKIASSAVRL